MRRRPQPDGFSFEPGFAEILRWKSAKIDDVVLELRLLYEGVYGRASTGIDGTAYKKGMIGDPVSKSKSLILMHDGVRCSIYELHGAAAIVAFGLPMPEQQSLIRKR